MANKVIRLSNTGAIAGGKYMQVMLDKQATILGFITPVRVEATLSGATVQSFGVAKRWWKFTALVQYSAPQAGYAALSDVEAWFSAQTIALSTFKFETLIGGTVYDAVLVNKNDYDPKPEGGRDIEYTTGWWRVPMELRQI